MQKNQEGLAGALLSFFRCCARAPAAAEWGMLNAMKPNPRRGMAEAQSPPSGEWRKPNPDKGGNAGGQIPHPLKLRRKSPPPHTYPCRLLRATRIDSIRVDQLTPSASICSTHLVRQSFTIKRRMLKNNSLHKPLEHLHIQMKHPGNLFYRRSILIPQLAGKLQPGIHTKHP